MSKAFFRDFAQVVIRVFECLDDFMQGQLAPFLFELSLFDALEEDLIGNRVATGNLPVLVVTRIAEVEREIDRRLAYPRAFLSAVRTEHLNRRDSVDDFLTTNLARNAGRQDIYIPQLRRLRTHVAIKSHDFFSRY